MRDGIMTGYVPKPVEGITPMQRIEVERRSVPCDGAVGVGGLGHPRVWLPMPAGQNEVTCPYCSITYVLKAEAGGGDGH